VASTRTYRWQSGDQLWFVCAKLLAESGFESVSDFVEAVRQANPSVLSWAAPDVPAGAVVQIPYVTS
jgi:Tfp pilus assembly protein FimV